MKTNKIVLLILNLQVFLLLALACGCKSTDSHVRYTAPRIEGRVLDSHTLQPVKGVEVRRLDPDANTQDQSKGGTMMQQTPAVTHTAANGGFTLPSQRDVSLFGGRLWYSVTLTFKHPGYEPASMIYDLANATNTPAGEPLVKAGDVLLQRRSK